MYSLFLKEIKGFLNSLTGYVVMAVFLVLTALFLWVFPMSDNILQKGFADINGLFAAYTGHHHAFLCGGAENRHH